MIRYSEESLSRYKNMLDADPTRAQTTLLTKVFQAKEDDKMTFNELRNTANAYIVAGTDTTANTLTYLTWLVCRNPEIKATLLEELCGLPEDFSDEHLKALPYLSQVIEEALRLYPAVPGGLPRSVPAEGAEVAGYTLPGGTTVCTQAYTMHRNPEAFPEPERFNPSRWADTTTEMKDSFMAFGRGARGTLKKTCLCVLDREMLTMGVSVCLGLHLAYMELRRGAACFFREFPEAKVSTMDGMCDEGMKPKIYFLINPSGKQCLVEGQ